MFDGGIRVYTLLSLSTHQEEPPYNTGPMPTDGYPEWYAGDTDPLDGLEEMSDGVFV